MKKSFLKNNVLLIGGLFSIIVPIILTSCSTTSLNNNNENNVDSNGNNGNHGSNNNGNNGNDGSSNNNGNNGENNNLPNDEFIDKNKNPELFLSKHLFNYNDLIKKTPLEIHESTPLYKSSLKNLEYLLKKENIDYIQNFHYDIREKIYEWYEEIGLIGEIGSNNIEKIKYAPRDYYKDKVLTQKYLDIFNSNNIQVITLNFNSEKINQIINSNPFGYLPSNLNQFLYYLTIEEISKLFNINNLKEVYANHDDKLGIIDIYFKKNDNGIYKLTLNKENSSLKKDDDFLQYIFDRSFMIFSNFWEFGRENIYDRHTFTLAKKGIGGSLWIIDRIDNKDLPNDTYEFLVGTNLHVLDYSKFFEKPFYFNIDNSVSKKYWDGGFRGWDTVIGNIIQTKDIKKTLTKNNDSIIKKSVEVFQSKTDPSEPIYMRMGTNNIKDVSKINVDDESTKNDYEYNIEWGSNKYIDLVWYTPKFKSSGIKTLNGADNMNIFGEEKNNGIGSIDDGGADFAVAKIKMKKNQIDKLLPNLGKVLGTENEKDWYIGLGKQEKIVANKTIYIGGYPEGHWNYSKSVGGRIWSKTRHVSFDNDTVPYWTKFDKSINDERNKKFHWYKDYETNHQPYYKGNNNQRKFEHGMKLSQLVQNSILNTSANRYLLGGASGSMAIDSKFNLVGFLFNGLTDNIGNPFYTNGIGLMDSLSTYDDWDGSIRNDIYKKIKKENLYTIKINPKIQ